MYSIVIDNEVLDYSYKKSREGYYFYVGDFYIGQLFYIRNAWTAVSILPNELCPLSGFKTRFHASEFLLKLQGYVK